MNLATYLHNTKYYQSVQQENESHKGNKMCEKKIEEVRDER